MPRRKRRSDEQVKGQELEQRGFVELGEPSADLKAGLLKVIDKRLQAKSVAKKTSFDQRWMVHLPLQKTWKVFTEACPEWWLNVIQDYLSQDALLVACVLLAVPKDSPVQRIHRDHYFLRGKELILLLSLEDHAPLKTLILAGSHMDPEEKIPLRHRDRQDEMNRLLPKMHVVQSSIALMDTYLKHAGQKNESNRDLTKRLFLVFRSARVSEEEHSFMDQMWYITKARNLLPSSSFSHFETSVVHYQKPELSCDLVLFHILKPLWYITKSQKPLAI